MLPGQRSFPSLPRTDDKNKGAKQPAAALFSKAEAQGLNDGATVKPRPPATNPSAKYLIRQESKASRTPASSLAAPAPGPPVPMKKTTSCPSSIIRRTGIFQSRSYTSERRSVAKAKISKPARDNANETTPRGTGVHHVRSRITEAGRQKRKSLGDKASSTSNTSSARERHSMELPKNFKSILFNTNGTLDVQTSESSVDLSKLSDGSMPSTLSRTSRIGEGTANTSTRQTGVKNTLVELRRRRGGKTLDVATDSVGGDFTRGNKDPATEAVPKKQTSLHYSSNANAKKNDDTSTVTTEATLPTLLSRCTSSCQSKDCHTAKQSLIKGLSEDDASTITTAVSVNSSSQTSRQSSSSSQPDSHKCFFSGTCKTKSDAAGGPKTSHQRSKVSANASSSNERPRQKASVIDATPLHSIPSQATGLNNARLLTGYEASIFRKSGKFSEDVSPTTRGRGGISNPSARVGKGLRSSRSASQKGEINKGVCKNRTYSRSARRASTGRNMVGMADKTAKKPKTSVVVCSTSTGCLEKLLAGTATETGEPSWSSKAAADSRSPVKIEGFRARNITACSLTSEGIQPQFKMSSSNAQLLSSTRSLNHFRTAPRKRSSSLPKRVGIAQSSRSATNNASKNFLRSATINDDSSNPSCPFKRVPQRKFVSTVLPKTPPRRTASPKEVPSPATNYLPPLIKSSHKYRRTKSLSPGCKDWEAEVIRPKADIDVLRPSLASFSIPLLCKTVRPIQCLVRQCLAKNAVEERKKSIVAVQSMIRRWVCVRYLKSVKVIALSCQSAYRGMITRDSLNFQHHCATRIQTAWRSFSGVMTFVGVVGRIVLIQSIWRMKHYHMKHHELKDKATLVQSVIRRRIAINLYTRLRETKAALIIQTNSRRFLAMFGFRFTLKDIVMCQATARLFLAKKHAATLRHTRETKAALMIQTNFRRFITMLGFMFTLGDIILCQATARRLLAMNRVTILRRDTKAAILIQTNYRMHRAVVNFEKQVLGTILCPATVRGFFHVAIFRRLTKGAVLIQTNYRKHRAMVDFENHLRRATKAALLVQTNYRMRRAMVDFEQQVLDYILCQGTSRSLVFKNTVYSKSSIKIQAAWRRHLALERIVLENRAATAIQTRFRGYWGFLSYVVAKFSVVQIQACLRRYLAKCFLKRLKQEKFIQELVNAAVVSIQTHVRRHLTKRRINSMVQNKRKTAATVIQSRFRGYWSFLSFVVVKFSVVQIQTCLRRHLAKCLLVRLKLEQRVTAAAVTIQSCFRGYQCFVRFIIAQYFAIKTQTCVRGYQARCRFKRLKHENKEKNITRNKRLSNVMSRVSAHMKKSASRGKYSGASKAQLQFQASRVTATEQMPLREQKHIVRNTPSNETVVSLKEPSWRHHNTSRFNATPLDSGQSRRVDSVANWTAQKREAMLSVQYVDPPRKVMPSIQSIHVRQNEGCSASAGRNVSPSRKPMSMIQLAKDIRNETPRRRAMASQFFQFSES